MAQCVLFNIIDGTSWSSLPRGRHNFVVMCFWRHITQNTYRRSTDKGNSVWAEWLSRRNQYTLGYLHRWIVQLNGDVNLSSLKVSVSHLNKKQTELFWCCVHGSSFSFLIVITTLSMWPVVNKRVLWYNVQLSWFDFSFHCPCELWLRVAITNLYCGAVYMVRVFLFLLS